MPRTLLLADDSITIQRVIELTFADEKSLRVVTVSDGDQAIARLETDPPDIVLADAGMPVKSGYDVARHIKRTPHLSHIPVILLTGASEPIDRARADEAGCDAVLVKPFEPDVVIGRVRELLARDRPAPSGSPPPASSSQWTLSAPQPAVSPTVEPPSTNRPALAEAFTSLLQAEQAGVPREGVEWPPSFAPPAQPAVTDQFLEEVVLRVLARLPEPVIRQAVADRVSDVAERLVREEIDRIKAFVK